LSDTWNALLVVMIVATWAIIVALMIVRLRRDDNDRR
jgi:hypothetical protein